MKLKVFKKSVSWTMKQNENTGKCLALEEREYWNAICEPWLNKVAVKGNFGTYEGS